MMSRPILIVSILLVFLIVLGGYFFWWPEYQNFQGLKLALEKKKAEFEQAEKYLSGLKTLSDKFAGYRDEVAKVDSALPSEPSIPALFDFIQKTGSQNGLILEEINLDKLPLGEGRIRKIPFSITVSGAYPAFKNFLSAVYRNARLIEVNSINFSSPIAEEKGGGSNFFKFVLNLEAHSY